MESSCATSWAPGSSPKRITSASGCSKAQLFRALRWIMPLCPRNGFPVAKNVIIVHPHSRKHPSPPEFGFPKKNSNTCKPCSSSSGRSTVSAGIRIPPFFPREERSDFHGRTLVAMISNTTNCPDQVKTSSSSFPQEIERSPSPHSPKGAFEYPALRQEWLAAGRFPEVLRPPAKH